MVVLAGALVPARPAAARPAARRQCTPAPLATTTGLLQLLLAGGGRCLSLRAGGRSSPTRAPIRSRPILPGEEAPQAPPALFPPRGDQVLPLPPDLHIGPTGSRELSRHGSPHCFERPIAVAEIPVIACQVVVRPHKGHHEAHV